MQNNQIINAHRTWQPQVATTKQPETNEILVKVKAASLNPVDLKRRSITNSILGYDATGEVVACGPEVTHFHTGDTVFYAGTTTRSGSFQQYQLMDAALVAHAPQSLKITERAGLPLVSLTAYELLFEKFHFIPTEGANQGKKILIINGAGGVGSIMSQLAKWAGLTVYATSSPEHFNWLKRCGVDYPLDYHQEQTPSLADLPANEFDAIAVLHNIQPYLEILARLVKPLGHIGTIVGIEHPLDIGLLKAKSISFDWEFMFAKAVYQTQMASQGQILEQIATLANQKKLHSITTQVYQGLTVASLETATKELETGHVIGKIVIAY